MMSMLKKCYDMKCNEKATCICNSCSKKFCEKHTQTHKDEKSKHILVSIFQSISDADQRELLQLYPKAMKHCSEVKTNLIKSINKCIKRINKLAKAKLAEIEEAENSCTDCIRDIISGKNPYKDELIILKGIILLEKTNAFEDYSKLSQAILEFFNLKLLDKADKIIKPQLSDNTNSNSLETMINVQKTQFILFSEGIRSNVNCIDLSTHKKIPIPSASSIILLHSQVCRMNEEEYFVYGGNNNKVTGDVSIFNLKKRTSYSLNK